MNEADESIRQSLIAIEVSVVGVAALLVPFGGDVHVLVGVALVALGAFLVAIAGRE